MLFACDSIEAFSQNETVDRLNCVKKLACAARFVRLQVTNEMPFDSMLIPQRFELDHLS